MARVVAIVSDLMLASRVTTSLGAAGHEVEQASSIPAELDGVDLIVADLDTVDPEELAGAGVPAIGFYSHVDADMKARADDGRDRDGGAALADGAGAAGPGREGPGARRREAALEPAQAGSRSSRNPSSTSSRPASERGRTPFASAQRSQASTARESSATVGRLRFTSGENARAATSSASWALCESGVDLGHLGGEVVDRRGRVVVEDLVAALEAQQQAAEDRVRLRGPGVDLGARGGEDQLGVARGAELVDAELAGEDSLLAQLDSLGVPEGRRRVDAARGQQGGGLEADRLGLDVGRA